MSDGALSQDEIDALLSGTDAAGSGGLSSGAGTNVRPIQDFLAETTEAQSASLSAQTGATLSLQGPDASNGNRDALLGSLPDQVVAVTCDFNAGFPGEHLFIMAEDTAKRLAALMNKEENPELDDMAMSVIGEVMNQVVGAQITALTNKTGNKTVSAVSPQATRVPKAVVALPGDGFTQAVYSLDLGDGTPHQLWEIYGSQAAQAISQALSPRPVPNTGPAPGAQSGWNPTPNMGGFPGMGPNVQSVQYPNLTPQMGPQAQGNIGLIMDVFMDVTVELGRTKKQIKEILGFGEGTIIELDKLAGEAVDILVNHKLIAKGEVVVIDENFGVRITDIISPMERVSEMG
ncbi:MAG: flagellar motor switch protein FliN [Treponema sp.]|jgi:flagellar motor switch protein FliN/FliY|nr:flagellar motor switch protein FliN [Treponema sp.]